MSLFLCMVWGCVLASLIYMWLSNFPNTTFWRDYLFSIVYSCLLCQRLIDLRCMGLFLGSLFCSIDPYVCFYANTMLFWLLKLCSIVWSGRVMPLALFFFLRIALAILGLLCFHRISAFLVLLSSSLLLRLRPGSVQSINEGALPIRPRSRNGDLPCAWHAESTGAPSPLPQLMT